MSLNISSWLAAVAADLVARVEIYEEQFEEPNSGWKAPPRNDPLVSLPVAWDSASKKLS